MARLGVRENEIHQEVLILFIEQMSVAVNRVVSECHYPTKMSPGLTM